jgi:hypothetical protein
MAKKRNSRINDDDQQRFERFFTAIEGCWEWRGATNGRYGVFRASKPRRRVYAHRVAYTTFCGADPGGLHVLHKCDNPLCVNPEHLFAGTAEDNVRDAISKGRAVAPPRFVGEAHPRARLTRKKVVAMRRAYERGATVAEVAERFRVAQGTAGHAIMRRTWKSVP